MGKYSYLISAIMYISISYSQLDVIYLKSGKVIKGELKRISGKNVTFKVKGNDKNKFYNTSLINTIKSWYGDIVYPKGVLANTKSKMYHLSNVEHINLISDKNFFENISEAEKQGYVPCKACFKTEPNISDYYLEKALVHELVKNIRIEQEIMYEHPKMEKLKNMMDKILMNWPEKLKGYDYRIHVIKNNTVNAMAVPAGNIYFHTGLLDIIEDDQELESVMVHEIAHVERRHGIRQYRKDQRNRSLKEAAVLLTAITAVATESEELLGAAVAIDLIGEVALKLLSTGYSREHEQESDIMAQIYFENQNKDKNMMISILDKMATNTIVNEGYIPPTNAYGSHPNIISRINQIKTSNRIEYDNNLIFQLIPRPVVKKNSKKKKNTSKAELDYIKKYKIERKFLSFEISNVFIQESSNKNDEFVFVLLGNIKNTHPYLNFDIQEIKLNFLGSIGKTPIEGLVDVIVPKNSVISFTGEINCKKDQKDKLYNNFINKKILPFSMKTGAVILESGKNPEYLIGLSTFSSSMIIK